MDSALHGDHCARADLQRAVDHVPPRRRGPVHLAIAAADPRTESVGESRTRIILCDAGFSVVPQAVMEDGSRFVARVDFLVDDGVVVEFDGMVKYDGLTGRAALAAEKDRESRLTGLGYEVVRIVWSDLASPADIVRRVRAAKRRARARRAALAQ